MVDAEGLQDFSSTILACKMSFSLLRLEIVTLQTSKVLFGSKNVTQMVMVMVLARLLAVTNLNRLVSNFNVVSDYGWTKTNMI
jgi:hypothetical protein